jgi:uncharacterized membrane protein
MSQVTPASRIETFSDGVFAIAITLLILDIRVPRVEDVNVLAASAGLSPGAALAQSLLKLWPHILAYALSFTVILVIWISQHQMFTHVRYADHAFMFLNGIGLMLVTAIPFPTALLSEYMAHYQPRQFQISVIIYSGHGMLIAIAFNSLWRYATRKGRLLAHDHDPAVIRKIHEQYRWGPVGYVLAFVLAFISPIASLALCLIFVILIAAGVIVGRRRINTRKA